MKIMIPTFLTSAKDRGLAITYDGFANRLLVSPKADMTEADAAFIRANREALVDAVIAATPVAAADHPETCPGVCPGVDSPLCAGCPQEEYRDANGLIYSAWCCNQNDTGKPVEVRERGTDRWREIATVEGP